VSEYYGASLIDECPEDLLALMGSFLHNNALVFYKEVGPIRGGVAYAVFRVDHVPGGLIVFGRNSNGDWVANPKTTRAMTWIMLSMLGAELPPMPLLREEES
jgi:hypothetical protein